MNSPRPSKRFDADQWHDRYWNHSQMEGGEFGLGLFGSEAQSQFAALVTEFTHLERRMEQVMALLVGTDELSAAHIMRTIVAASSKIALMEHLLENGRSNAHQPPELDEILAEFRAINAHRNAYVHAIWETDLNTGAIWISKPRTEPTVLVTAAMVAFDLAEMKSIRSRINDLMSKIVRAVAIEYQKMDSKDGKSSGVPI